MAACRPLLREPARAARDIRRWIVSVPAAARDYGVVVDLFNFAVDESATAAGRKALQ